MQFSDQETAVLRMRLMENRTLREVGAYFGVTRERVRQIEARAIRKMKVAFHSGVFTCAQKPILKAIYAHVFQEKNIKQETPS